MLRIKSQILTLGLAVSALASASSFAGQDSQVTYGDRYVVKYRSLSTFRTLNAQLLASMKTFSKDAFGRTIATPMYLPGSNALVQKSLANFQMMIVAGAPADIEQLKSNPEVAYVEREMFFPAPRPMTYPSDTTRDRHETILNTPGKVADSEITWGLKAVNAPQAWALKTTSQPGEGVKVLVLDTGIDKDHPDLKNRFAEGKNLITKKDSIDAGPSPDDNFLLSGIKTLLSGSTTELPGQPAYDYFDQIGHGTHVSGTIAAEMDGQGVVGVAPFAKIYMGRVCGKFGCSTTALIDGLHWAQQIGADVVNMSLGGPMSSDAQEEAMAQTKAAGIIPVAAAGNDGTDKLGYPAAYSSVISVAAIDSTFKRATFSQFGPELVIAAPGVDILSSIPLGTGRASKVAINLGGTFGDVPSQSFVGSSMPKQPLQADFVFAKLGKPEDFAGLDLHGKIALVQRGEIHFADKVTNAIAVGAIGVVVYNNEPGLLSGAITQDGSEVGIPVAMIEQTVGENVVKALQAGTTVSTKIDIVKADYASFQGTSMACPHVVGVVALIRWANPKITPDQVVDVLKTTARKPNDTDDNIAKNQYGAGVIDAAKAVQKALSL